MRNAFASSLYQEALRDPRIIIVTADISPVGDIHKFREQFPDRFINVGVAEMAMIDIAAGMALKGKRVFCYTIANFALYRPFEAVRLLAYQGLPVTVVGMGAGVSYADHGGTHQTLEDVAIASAIPNMQVIAPCDPSETVAATQWCARESKGPVYLRLGKAGEPYLAPSVPWEFGKPRPLRLGSQRRAILSYGPITKLACELSDRFSEAGEPAAVYSCHTLKPLPVLEIEKLIWTYDRIIVIEEHVRHGGLAARVKEIAWDAQRATFDILGFTLEDAFVHCNGKREDMLKAHGLDLETIWEKVKP